MLKRIKNIIIALFLVDLLFIVLHLAFGSRLTLLNLEVEKNLPTFYQGLKAVLIGLVIFKIPKFKILGLIISYIGLDEILIIHERTENYFRLLFPKISDKFLCIANLVGYKSVSWVIILFPIFVGLGIYFFRLLTTITVKKKNIIVVSILFFLFALITEIINSQSGIPVRIYHHLIALEEGCELLGITNLLRLKIQI